MIINALWFYYEKKGSIITFHYGAFHKRPPAATAPLWAGQNFVGKQAFPTVANSSNTNRFAQQHHLSPLGVHKFFALNFFLTTSVLAKPGRLRPKPTSFANSSATHFTHRNMLCFETEPTQNAAARSYATKSARSGRREVTAHTFCCRFRSPKGPKNAGIWGFLPPF